MIRREAYRSMNMLNAFDVFDMKLTGKDYPELESCFVVPNNLIPFDKCIRSVRYDSWVHFYIEDYQFERIWTSPNRYVNLLSRFEGIISPDFSIYYDMPIHMKRWNMYRNKFISAYMQNRGINVIPSIQIVDPVLWEDSINGIAKGGIISVNATGIKRRYFAKQIFKQQMRFIINSLEPIAIICYGSDGVMREYDNVLYFDNNHIKRLRDVQRNRIATEL